MDLLPIVIIVGFLLFVVHFTSKIDQKAKDKLIDPSKEKRCPIHKWCYEQQPGMEDVMYLRCQWCLKTPQEVNEGK